MTEPTREELNRWCDELFWGKRDVSKYPDYCSDLNLARKFVMKTIPIELRGEWVKELWSIVRKSPVGVIRDLTLFDFEVDNAPAEARVRAAYEVLKGG